MAKKAHLNVSVDAEVLREFKRLNIKYGRRFREPINLSVAVRHLLDSLVSLMMVALDDPQSQRLDERNIFIGYKQPVEFVKQLIELYKEELEGGEKKKTG